MPVEVVSYMLGNKDLIKRLQFQIILQCAPFLKGIKVACITNVDKSVCKELKGILVHTEIEYKILSVQKNRCLIFFFRREAFARYLLTPEVKAFLNSYHYEEMGIDAMLDRLSDRTSQYANQNMGFPHEIGAFLEYPIKDVEGFILNQGKNCLLSGYWKVYENLSKAKLIFDSYDRAKVCAVNEFLVGKSMKEISCS